MAKVVLPCLGIEARGTVGKGIVYSNYLGDTRARAWSKPRDPKSAGQTRDRSYFMAAAHFSKFVAQDSELSIAIRGVVTEAVPWAGYLIGILIGLGNATIEAALSAWDEAGNVDLWTSYADLWRVEDKKHPLAEIDTITGGEILFVGANAVHQMGISYAPAAPADMSDGEVDAFMMSMMLGGREIA